MCEFHDLLPGMLTLAYGRSQVSRVPVMNAAHVQADSEQSCILLGVKANSSTQSATSANRCAYRSMICALSICSA